MIDPLNVYRKSILGEKYLIHQLHGLTSYLNFPGGLTIFVVAQHGLVAVAESPVDLSYLADTVVSLRFFEAVGEVRQSIAIIKKRSGPHEKTIRELTIAKEGITVSPPLTQFRGVLPGVPVDAATIGIATTKPREEARGR